MVKFEFLKQLEKVSSPDLNACKVVFDAEENGVSHLILECGEKLYYRKKRDNQVTCCEVAVDWIPKEGTVHYAYTPDDKHFCTVECTLAQARELAWNPEDLTKNYISFNVRQMDKSLVNVGDSCSYGGRTISVADGNHLSFNDVKIRVFPSHEFTYKLNKKSISAIGGVQGLYAFLERVSAENRYCGTRYPLWSTVWNIIFEHFNADLECGNRYAE